MANAKEKEGQPRWTNLSLEDLRHITWLNNDSPPLLQPGENKEIAEKILREVFDIKEHEESVTIDAVNGLIEVPAKNLPHIAEKRNDARERFALVAISTMKDPFEIWEVKYTQEADGEHPSREFTRLAYIGFFQNSKHQLLVTIEQSDGLILWNFMNQDKKSLNKHRHGKLVYSKKKPQ